ncbi:hypothetical protein [Cardinium endosymbiont of Philonthus spinipes]|uniref:hypothetical protein n=1 Tax=Cardinium endosymbiont of Philonthus spinipes TaxID=3077941 RepID=UPI00313AACC0
MFVHHFIYIFSKQKKQQAFIAVIHYSCFVLLGLFTHVQAIQKIATPHFSILFDTNSTSSAERIANTLETIYKPVSKTLGVYPSPIRLILDSQSTELNAYFKPLPRHIYFDTLYYSNPYFIGNADWFDMVCIHEFRHAAQHSIEYHSTPFWLKLPYFAWNVVAVCGVDSFFKEGDAVGMETALSKSGRGRLPGWEKIYKVNLLERDKVSFSRQIFGSLKHELASDYHIGYYFTTHIRRKYGAHAIQSIFEKTMRGIPYFGFHNAVKKVTKKSIPKVYEEMNQELRLSWQKQLEGLKITPATQLTIKKPNDSFDYNNPFMDTSGNLMAWKIGIGLRAQLVQVNMAPASSKKKSSLLQKDKTILYFIKSSLPPAAFAIGEGCAAWLEPCHHPWQANTQTIRLQHYDFKQKKRRTLVSSSRYTALAMSPNTQQLVAVTTDPSGNHLLVILETKSGKVVKKIANPDNGYYLTPSWSGEDHIIVVKTKNQQNSILRINVATSKEEILLPYTHEHRSYPKIYKDYLLYNSSYNGIDNIYAMHLSTKACFQVTSRKYGAYLGMVHPINNQLIFNDYSKNGMEIAAMPFDPTLWTPLEEVEDRSVRYYEPLVAQEQHSDILSKVANHQYPITKHSFSEDYFSLVGPDAEEPNWRDRGIKIKLFQLVDLKDKLNITPYFYQNFNLFKVTREDGYRTSELGLKIKYITAYPILDLDLKGIKRKSTVLTEYIKASKQPPRPILLCPQGVPVCIPSKDYISDTYWTPTLNLGIKFPYYFNLGSTSGTAHLKAEIDLEQCATNRKIGYSQTYTFNIHNESTKSNRDIYSPWYQSLELSLYYPNKDLTLLKGHESMLYLEALFRVPGIGNHHYFSLHPAIKRFKRVNSNATCWGQRINLTYGLPLAYPEWGIPLIWFLEKIWIEAYCNTSQLVTFDTIGRSFDNIGANLHFKSRFLSNRNIPYALVAIDFPIFRKGHNGWVFQALTPNFHLSFHLEARKEVEFTKKNKL